MSEETSKKRAVSISFLWLELFGGERGKSYYREGNIYKIRLTLRIFGVFSTMTIHTTDLQDNRLS